MNLPTTPGPVHVSVREYASQIFALDTETADATPYLFPIATKEELADFLETEHDAKSFIWNSGTGEPVGYMSYIDTPDAEGHAELLNIMIRPKYWRRGYGEKMVRHYHDLIRRAGIRRSKLVTSPNNTNAIAFYEKLGYSKKGIIKDYYGPAEDRVLMTIALE